MQKRTAPGVSSSATPPATPSTAPSTTASHKRATAADAVALPITAHAFTRQARRAQSGLTELLAAPPQKITLSYAQEFMAAVWGRSSYHNVTCTTETVPGAQAQPGAQRGAQLDQQPGRAQPVGPDFYLSIGPARTKALLIQFMGEADGYWSQAAATLVGILVDAEFLRCNLPDRTASRLRLQFDRIFGAEPLSCKSLCAYLALDKFEAVAAALSASSEQSLVNMADNRVIERMREVLRDIPGYNEHKLGAQAEDAVMQFAYAARMIRPAVHALDELLRKNPVFWRSSWGTYPSSADCERLEQDLPLVCESWLYAQDAYDLKPLAREARAAGGVADARSALRTLSFGAHSPRSKFLYRWLCQPELLAEMAAAIDHAISGYVAQERWGVPASQFKAVGAAGAGTRP